MDGFSILNEEFPALPGSSGRPEETFGGRGGTPAAGLSQPSSQQQPTTARGGFALMPAVSGADSAYGGGSGGGDAAIRAQVCVSCSVCESCSHIFVNPLCDVALCCYFCARDESKGE